MHYEKGTLKFKRVIGKTKGYKNKCQKRGNITYYGWHFLVRLTLQIAYEIPVMLYVSSYFI